MPVRSLLNAIPFVLFCGAAPALAQGLSTTELWASWQETVAQAGGTLTATETREGNKLTLNDLNLLWAEDGNSPTRLRLNEVVLMGRADGAVGITLPSSFPLWLDLPRASAGAGAEANTESDPAAPPADWQPETLQFTLASQGLDLAVRGIGKRADFSAAAAALTVTLDEMLPPPPADMDVASLELSGSLAELAMRWQHDFSGKTLQWDGEAQLGAVSLDLKMHEPGESQSHVTLTLGQSDAALRGVVPPSAQNLAASALPQDQNLAAPLLTPVPPANPQPLLAALADGLALEGHLNTNDARLLGKINDPETGPAEVDLAFGNAGMMARLDTTIATWDSYLLGAGLTANGQINGAPAEAFSLSLSEFRKGMTLGLNGLTSSQPWSWSFVLRNLEMSESIWQEAGLTKDLPRDPMSAVFSLNGRFALDKAALSEEWVGEAGISPLRELSVKSDDLFVKGFGTELTGKADLSFDMSDLSSYQGLPAPTGKVELVATGINQLVEILQKTGLVSPEDTTSLRLGLMMIAKAGDAPDQLKSLIEFQGASFSLNGMKMR